MNTNENLFINEKSFIDENLFVYTNIITVNFSKNMLSYNRDNIYHTNTNNYIYYDFYNLTNNYVNDFVLTNFNYGDIFMLNYDLTNYTDKYKYKYY
jgi:hypothetical protein